MDNSDDRLGLPALSAVEGSGPAPEDDDDIIDAEFSEASSNDAPRDTGVPPVPPASTDDDSAPPNDADAFPFPYTFTAPPDDSPDHPPADFSQPQLRELLVLRGVLDIDLVRPRVLLYLAGHGPTCVGDLAAALSIDQKVLSSHLARLKDKNLLDYDRRSRRVFYKTPDGVVTYRRENGQAHLELSRGGGLKLTVTLTLAPPASG